MALSFKRAAISLYSLEKRREIEAGTKTFPPRLHRRRVSDNVG